MWHYIKRRLITLIPVIWGAVTLVFLMIHLVPGDPVQMMLGENATREQVESVRHELGLDRSMPEMYISFWKNLFTGDLGKSILTKRPVWDDIQSRLPNTALLAVISLVVSGLIGVMLGVISAVYKNKWPDHSLRILSIIGVSMPVFWLGPLLMLLFAVKLHWLPITGGTDLMHLILPAGTLALGLASVTMRMTRASMIEELNKDYILVARAKGLSESKVILRHALRNALIPVITIIGYQLGALLTGTVIVEYVFAYPGIGRLLIFSILRRDYPTIQGVVLIIVLIYITVNFLTDLSYKMLDVRMKL